MGLHEKAGALSRDVSGWQTALMTPKSRIDVFIYLAVVTGLPFALAMAALLKEDLTGWIVTGALFGLVMAAFGTPRLVGDTRTVPFQAEKEAMIGRINIACAQLGYEPNGRTGDFLSYKAGGDSAFSIGPIKIAPASYLAIAVQVERNMATIVGPQKPVVELERRLQS